MDRIFIMRMVFKSDVDQSLINGVIELSKGLNIENCQIKEREFNFLGLDREEGNFNLMQFELELIMQMEDIKYCLDVWEYVYIDSDGTSVENLLEEFDVDKVIESINSGDDD